MLPEHRNDDSSSVTGSYYPVMKLTQEAYDALHTICNGASRPLSEIPKPTFTTFWSA